MINAKNIHKQFGDRVVLSGIDIEVKPSGITCLIGPSGCGKTTLLKTMSLLEWPELGSLRIGDREFSFPVRSKPDLTGLYPNLTVVFQQFQLWKHLKVRENLLLPIRSVHSDRQGLFDELVETLNLSGILDNYPYEISVGQKQRVAFARAALTKPKYLLLDEVTSSLDLEHIEKVRHLIKRMAQEGAGILLATHLIGFAKAIADQVLFLDRGKIVEQGGVEILATPRSTRLKQFLSLTE